MNTTEPSQDQTPTEGLEIYQVGGSVRDELMDLPVTDRDYVVVGSTPKEMIERGFLPVGKDFPVFLHPRTHEEYALARTERKTAPGYHGFVFDASPEVTLEEDLARRDLTVNAMAIDASGQLIDPYHGRLDLAQGVLRHVSDAFSEDPVRVLRLARFATRFDEFSIADSTLKLCQSMAQAGELNALVPERVWAEMAKALMYDTPSRFIQVLNEAHALAIVWPSLHQAFNDVHFDRAMHALDRAAVQGASLEVRFALLCKAVSNDEVDASCQQLKVPKRCRQWALWANQHLDGLIGLAEQSPEVILNFIQSFDGLRQSDRMSVVSRLAQARWGATSDEKASTDALDFLQSALSDLGNIDAKPWLDKGLDGLDMARAIESERLARIAQCQQALR